MTMMNLLVALAATFLFVVVGVVDGFSTTTTTAPQQAAVKTQNQQVPGLKNGMDYVQLGDSDLVVSKICMGTMTFGEQNTLEDGVAQLTKAVGEYGVNFIDTAEMYPVPGKAETQGMTDKTVGAFLKQSKTSRRREDIILATKVCGRAPSINWMPGRSEGETTAVTRKQVLASVDQSLQRLGTDYVDLLQIHWPDRYAGGLFGAPDFRPSAYEEAEAKLGEESFVSFEEQLSAMQALVEAGKVRYIGVSNETPYGVCAMAHLAKQYPDLYPKIVSIQNSYSLVVRKDYEAGLGEACYHHNVGLLAYSPLAGGSLTGKYRVPDKVPKSARLNLFPGFMDRYLGSQNEVAVNAYCDLAEKHGLTPASLAESWCYHNELVASTIIGATSTDQLTENLNSYDIKLEQEVQDGITDIYKQYCDPTKTR